MTDFAAVGALGTATGFDFTTYTLTVSPTSDVPAGDLVVVFAAWTSHYFFGPDGEMLPEMSCVDDAGNLYQQLCGTYNNQKIYPTMFVSRLRNDLLTTDTITLKHYGQGAKAVSLHQFSLNPDKRFGLKVYELAINGSPFGVDPPADTITGLDASKEYLLLHVLGAYGQQTETYTWDSDYTQIAGAGTSGHGNGGGVPPPGDVYVRGGYRIVSGITSDTVDVTNLSSAPEMAQVVAALEVVELDDDYPDFPNTPLLDNFNRANEDPNSGAGLWDSTGIHPGFGFAYTRVDTNKAARSTSGSGSGSEYLDVDYFSDDGLGEMEEWGTVAVGGDIVMLFGSGAGSSADFTGTGLGYRTTGLRAQNMAGTPIAAVCWGQTSFFGDIPTGSRTGLVWGEIANGTRLGFQQLVQDGRQQHLWMDVGSGWEWVACQILSVDTVGAGRFGIGFEGNATTRLDDFGGGMLSRFAQQIIRRPPDPGGARMSLP